MRAGWRRAAGGGLWLGGAGRTVRQTVTVTEVRQPLRRPDTHQFRRVPYNVRHQSSCSKKAVSQRHLRWDRYHAYVCDRPAL